MKSCRVLMPLLSAAAGLLLAGLAMQASGYDVGAAYQALFVGATGLESGPARSTHDIPLHLGSWVGHFSEFALAQSLARTTPLLLVGLGVALALRAGLFNIGAQGQMQVGALTAAVVGTMAGKWPMWVAAPMVLLAGAAGGAFWGAIPGLLRARRGVQEVLSTIMLNYVAIALADYLLSHNLKDPNPANMAMQTARLPLSAQLPPLIPGAGLTVGIFLALFAAFAMTFLFRRTALGFQIRAVGEGAEAAQAAGIPTGRVLIMAMALSGAAAGVAGALEVMGVHHRYVQGVAGSYGFDGIAVALLGGLDGVGTTASALFFGLLANGAQGMQARTDVPDSIATVVQAVVILLMGARFLSNGRGKREGKREEDERAIPTEGVSDART